jgi:hypothetical protein
MATLRGHAGNGHGGGQPNLESRPVSAASRRRHNNDNNNKKLGVLQRWIGRMTLSSSTAETGNGRSSSTTTMTTMTTSSSLTAAARTMTTTTTTSIATAATTTAAMSMNNTTTAATQQLVNNVVHFHGHGHQHRHFNMVYNSPTTSDLMPWLQQECPRDLLGHILSYAGPQTVQILNRTNTFWHDLIKEESTWRSLCEGMYKVRPLSAINVYIHVKNCCLY